METISTIIFWVFVYLSGVFALIMTMWLYHCKRMPERDKVSFSAEVIIMSWLSWFGVACFLIDIILFGIFKLLSKVSLKNPFHKKS